MEIIIDGETVVMNGQCSSCFHMVDGHCNDTGEAPPVRYCMDMHNISVLWDAVGRGCDGWQAVTSDESEEVE